MKGLPSGIWEIREVTKNKNHECVLMRDTEWDVEGHAGSCMIIEVVFLRSLLMPRTMILNYLSRDTCRKMHLF